MAKLTVKNCSDCPMLKEDVGPDRETFCNHPDRTSYLLKNSDYWIIDYLEHVPKKCPLRQDSITIRID